VAMENLFVGVWQLVSCEAVRQNGRRVPIYGKKPVGRLCYDANGNMSVQIMRAGRRPLPSGTKHTSEWEEMRAAYEGYEAYFSTYSVDTARGTIHHTVIGSLYPNWTGTVQTRLFEFQGNNRLVLRTEPVDGTKPAKNGVKLVWERLLQA
jgi:hypothetical protein